jgi:hypothetical protein
MVEIVDYNCVIKTLKITNEEGIWDSDEAIDFITKNYDINAMKYGQVIHVWNVNPSGDELNEFYVVYDNKLVDTRGDQYFRLHYDFTKNITDICAKYPEYTFTTDSLGCCLPKTLGSEEDFYQQMSGEVRGDDAYVKLVRGETYSDKVWIDENGVDRSS